MSHLYVFLYIAPEKKEEPKPEQNPHKEPRKFNIPWTNEEVTALFFEALNEYGKDFESIHSTISLKLKKKGVSDELTKEQVRHIYYRTWHKISKYLKFSEGKKYTHCLACYMVHIFRCEKEHTRIVWPHKLWGAKEESTNYTENSC